MERIRITDACQQWLVAGEAASPEYRARLSDEELRHEFRVHQPGDDGTLRLFEMKLPPNSVIEPHSHELDEIIFVVAGELALGARRLGPGSSVFIAGGTLYSVRSGLDGLQFLNFRARPDPTHRNRAEHLALSRQAPTRPTS
ncbi:MAG: cupin domain-containing protein [Acidimicrobiia bacterium]